MTIDSNSVLKFGLNIVHKLKGIAADKKKVCHYYLTYFFGESNRYRPLDCQLLHMQSKLREISPRLNYAIPPSNMVNAFFT